MLMVSRFSDLAYAVLDVVQDHPKRIAGALGALLLGTGVTAFGIVPLAPDAAKLPVRQVLDAVALEGVADHNQLAGQLNGLERPLVLYRTDHTRRDDSLSSLLARLGVNDPGALAYLRTSAAGRDLLTGKAGKLVTAEATVSKQLQSLTVRSSVGDDRLFRKVVIQRSAKGFTSKTELGMMHARLRMASGVIQSSLFAATDAALVPDNVANQLAEIFSSDIDFRRDLRRGDRFTVIYESLEADGEPMGNGRVLSAEFVNDGKAIQSLWFQEPGGKGGYYGFDGQSKRRSFLAAPLEFSRVSSGYGMRFHPVSGINKAHLGVDYAAPTGTPIRAVGDGVVDFAGWQNGYGNFVVINHRGGQSTAYGHLSKIHVRKGQRVDQGNLIGAVGSTGVSTGPHLHFEFRDNGVHKDPLTLARYGEAVPVSASSRSQFNTLAARMQLELAASSSLATASAE